MSNITYNGGKKINSPLATRSTATVGVEFAFALLVNTTALLGNLLVCTAIYRNKRLRSVTGFFMLSLAISDVLMATLCMPLSVGASLAGGWVYGDSACQVQGYLINTLAAVSLHTMALTAIHRYFRVVRSETCRKLFTKKRTVFLISAVWLTVLFVPALEMVLGAIVFVFHQGKVICFIDSSTRSRWLANLSTFIVLNMALPMAIVFICYFKVFKRVRQHKVDVSSSLHNSNVAATQNQHKASLATNVSQQGQSLAQNLKSERASVGSTTWTIQGNGKQTIVEELTAKLENLSMSELEEPQELRIEKLELNHEQQRIISAKYKAESETSSQPRSIISDWRLQPKDQFEMLAPLDQHRCSVVSYRSQSLGPVLPSHSTAYTDVAPTLFQQRKSIAVVTLRRSSVVVWLNQQRDLLSTTMNKTRTNVAPNLQLKANVEDIKITSVLFVVVLGFMLCWFPILVISVYMVSSGNDPLPRVADLLYTYLGAASSAINPCIYGLMNRSFRSEYLKIIRCKRHHNS